MTLMTNNMSYWELMLLAEVEGLSGLRVYQGGVDITPVFSVKWHDSRY